MHILYLMPASGFGGAERQGVLHIHWLRRLGHCVTAIVGRSEPMVRNLADTSNDTIWFDDFPPTRSAKSTVLGDVMCATRWLRGVTDVAGQLEHLIRERDIDVIFANRTFAWAIAAQLNRFTGCPFVLRAGSRPRRDYLAMGARLFRSFDAEPSLFISNCHAVEDRYKAYIRVPRMILPNAVDLEVFQPRNRISACQVLGLEYNRPRVALAIRPSADKGLTFLRRGCASNSHGSNRKLNSSSQVIVQKDCILWRQ